MSAHADLCGGRDASDGGTVAVLVVWIASDKVGSEYSTTAKILFIACQWWFGTSDGHVGKTHWVSDGDARVQNIDAG